jgi:deazaflavin-dependent oxidoreductase (nitroreductase family)
MEHEGWNALRAGRARDYYAAALTDDAEFVVSGRLLDREQTLASWEGVPPWRDVELSEEQTLAVTDDVLILTYVARASRGDAMPPYVARFTTVYVRKGSAWRVAFHQQTPSPTNAVARSSFMSSCARRIARAPLALYRWQLGWMLGHRFLRLVHRGRRTGREHEAVLEVLRFDASAGDAIVVSGFGPRADWYRNVLEHPRVLVEIGRDHFDAVAEPLEEGQAVQVLAQYEARHPMLRPFVHRLVSRLVGWRYRGTSDAERRRVVQVMPMIRLRRDGERPAAAEDLSRTGNVAVPPG